jgi:hypothetical protein
MNQVKPTMVEENDRKIQPCHAQGFPGGVFSGTPTSLVVLPALQGKSDNC